MISYILRKFIYALPLFFGVTFISFLLLVYCSPDPTFSLLGKNAAIQDIQDIRHELGYDLSFFQRYVRFLYEIFSFDFGRSYITQERVAEILLRAVPVSLSVMLPSFIFGNGLSLLIGLVSTYMQGTLFDKAILFLTSIGMSFSIIIVVIAFQFLFCSIYGLNIFPVQGWDMSSFYSYLQHATVPIVVLVFVSLCYNTRYFRGLLVEEFYKDHVRTAIAYGSPIYLVLTKHVLRNAFIPIITRIIFMLPIVIVGGSLVVESFFSIPGIGSVTYEALSSGDVPILKAVMICSSALYISLLTWTDILYKFIDPRISIEARQDSC